MTLYSQNDYKNNFLECLSELNFHESLKQKENNQLDVLLTNYINIIVNRSCGNEFIKSSNTDQEAFVVALQQETEIKHKSKQEKFAFNKVDLKISNYYIEEHPFDPVTVAYSSHI